jgi:ribosomal protein S18 acetylase RimI-like enzyme
MAPQGTLTESRGLTPEDLAEIAALERVSSADGVRLKLEWPTLTRRDPQQLNDFLWHDAGELVGFLGLYQFAAGQVEICGMVHPRRRREGIFTRLLAAARAEILRRGITSTLLVTDRASQAATEFARSAGGIAGHSEYSMTLARPPVLPPPGQIRHPELLVRAAVPGDGGFVDLCIRLAFEGAGNPARDPADSPPLDVSDPDQVTVIFELAGTPVGTAKISHSETGSYIFGFAMLPEYRGRGFGHQVLARLVADLLADGHKHISLEVATSNDRALELYKSTGFETEATLDYFALWPAAAGGAGGAGARQGPPP